MENELKSWKANFDKLKVEIDAVHKEIMDLKSKQNQLSTEINERVDTLNRLNPEKEKAISESAKKTQTKEEIETDMNTVKKNFKEKVKILLNSVPDLKEDKKTKISNDLISSLDFPVLQREVAITFALKEIHP